MSVYHFQEGQLVKLCDDLSQIIGEDREGNPDQAFAKAGFSLSEEVEGVYVGYAADAGQADSGPLAGYGYAFTVEDISSTLPWTLLVRDALPEYLEAMRLLQPLFARTTFLEIEAEIARRLEEEVAKT